MIKNHIIHLIEFKFQYLKHQLNLQKTYELEALMYRLRQINAEVQEEDSTGQLIAKVNIENIPEANASKSKLPVKPIDSNRLSTSQLYSKHGCVVLAEESSSRR